MNKRRRKKWLKKKYGAKAYKEAERRSETIFKAFAEVLAKDV